MSNLKSKCCGKLPIHPSFGGVASEGYYCVDCGFTCEVVEEKSEKCKHSWTKDKTGDYPYCAKCGEAMPELKQIDSSFQPEKSEKCPECQFEESHSQECSRYKPSLTYKAQTDGLQFEYGTVNKEGISFSSNYSVVIGNNQTGKPNYLTIGFDDDIIVDKEITKDQADKLKKLFIETTNIIREEERNGIIKKIEDYQMDLCENSQDFKNYVINLLKSNEKTN